MLTAIKAVLAGLAFAAVVLAIVYAVTIASIEIIDFLRARVPKSDRDHDRLP